MKLELHAAVPLLVRHLEQVDSGHGTSDVQQRVDPTELRQCPIDEGLGCSRDHQIEIDCKRLGALRPHRVSDFSKGGLASCGEDDDSEVAGELRA